MDMISMTCPNCGGVVERKKDEYFTRCPFCGAEIGFDELKEEVQVDVYREKLDELESSGKEDLNNRNKIKRWLKTRNVMYIVMGILHLLGWSFMGISDNETLIGIGVIILICAWAVLFVLIPALGYSYPDYDILTGKEEKIKKLPIIMKLLSIGVAICLITVFASFLVLSLMGFVN